MPFFVWKACNRVSLPESRLQTSWIRGQVSWSCLDMVLVCCRCRNKIPQTGWFQQVQDQGATKCVSGESSFWLGDGRLLSVSSHSTEMGRERELSGASSVWNLFCHIWADLYDLINLRYHHTDPISKYTPVGGGGRGKVFTMWMRRGYNDSVHTRKAVGHLSPAPGEMCESTEPCQQLPPRPKPLHLLVRWKPFCDWSHRKDREDAQLPPRCPVPGACCRNASAPAKL